MKMLYGGLAPDSVCCYAVIDSCAKAKVSEAKVALTTVTYNALINTCAKAALPKALRKA